MYEFTWGALDKSISESFQENFSQQEPQTQFSQRVPSENKRVLSQRSDFESDSAALNLISEVLDDKDCESQNVELMTSLNGTSGLLYEDVDMEETKNIVCIDEASLVTHMSTISTYAALVSDTFKSGSSQFSNSFALVSSKEFNEEIRLKLEPLVTDISQKSSALEVPLFLPFCTLLRFVCFLILWLSLFLGFFTVSFLCLQHSFP